mgnify:CR=1 FL=1
MQSSLKTQIWFLLTSNDDHNSSMNLWLSLAGILLQVLNYPSYWKVIISMIYKRGTCLHCSHDKCTIGLLLLRFRLFLCMWIMWRLQLTSIANMACNICIFFKILNNSKIDEACLSLLVLIHWCTPISNVFELWIALVSESNVYKCASDFSSTLIFFFRLSYVFLINSSVLNVESPCFDRLSPFIWFWTRLSRLVMLILITWVSSTLLISNTLREIPFPALSYC